MPPNPSQQKQRDFQAIEIEASIRILLNEITLIRNNSPIKQKHDAKFNTWIKQLNCILDQISKCETEALPLISNDLGYSFMNKNLFVTAMLQPSFKKTFDEIKTHFETETETRISVDMLNKLAAGPDTAKSLAWIGDTALHYAISKSIWEPELTTEVLHNKRRALESNENLSILCNRWKLFENRINLDLDPDVPKGELNNIKGTLTEAIFGVIFIEKNIEGVEAALRLIDPSGKNC